MAASPPVILIVGGIPEQFDDTLLLNFITANQPHTAMWTNVPKSSSGTTKGYGFVAFSDEATATAAAGELKSKKLVDAEVTARLAKSRDLKKCTHGDIAKESAASSRRTKEEGSSRGHRSDRDRDGRRSHRDDRDRRPRRREGGDGERRKHRSRSGERSSRHRSPRGEEDRRSRRSHRSSSRRSRSRSREERRDGGAASAAAATAQGAAPGAAGVPGGMPPAYLPGQMYAGPIPGLPPPPNPSSSSNTAYPTPHWAGGNPGVGGPTMPPALSAGGTTNLMNPPQLYQHLHAAAIVQQQQQQQQQLNPFRVNPQQEKINREIHLGNTNPAITPDQLSNFVNAAMIQGELVTAPGPCVMTVRCSGKFAFAEFRTQEEANNAMNLSNIILMGRPLRIARPRNYTGPNPTITPWPIWMAQKIAANPALEGKVIGMPDPNDVLNTPQALQASAQSSTSEERAMREL